MCDSTQHNLGQLPYAEKEAILVASIIGTIPVLREQATKQSVLYRLRSAKVIHQQHIVQDLQDLAAQIHFLCSSSYGEIQ